MICRIETEEGYNNNTYQVHQLTNDHVRGDYLHKLGSQMIQKLYIYSPIGSTSSRVF